jgi:uncharacterized membrane protein/mono/diheme cytochrome c family protein
MFEFLGPLLGRLHPVLVHLPIGILVFGILLCFISKMEKNSLLPAARLAFLLGGIGAVFSALSGFLQYQFEGFAWDEVKFHLIAGVITTLASFFLYQLLRKSDVASLKIRMTALGLALALTVTGHLGGNLTHGSSYLTEVLPPGLQSLAGIEIEPEKGPTLQEDSWENAELFSDVIQPILNQNCKSCHNPRNQKGELDLTSFKGLLAGGKNGFILTHGDAEQSELYSRLILDKDDDAHMPPREKRQPSKEEIALIEGWIKSGAKETGTLAEADITRKMVEGFIQKDELPFYPTVILSPIAGDSLAVLKAAGFFAEAVESGSGLLKVSCINFGEFGDNDWMRLEGVKNRLAYLDISGTKVTDLTFDHLADLSNLTVLKLSQTSITGKSLNKLTQLPHLKLLYLNDTEVSLAQIESLASSQSLEKLFIYKTPASLEIVDFGNLKFPFLIEFGNYTLPKLPSDTVVY